MTHRIAMVLLAGLLHTTVVRGEDAKADLDKLQGSWDVTALEAEGQSILKEIPGKVTATFTGDKLVFDGLPGLPDGKPVKREFVVKLDPSKNPKEMDQTSLSGTFKGTTFPGIYQLDGDVLKLCMPDLRTKKRPGEFKSSEGSELVVMTLKRVKK